MRSTIRRRITAKRLLAILSLTLLVSVLTAGLAIAAGLGGDDGVINSASDIHGHTHAQHGGTAGHLPATQENVKLVGKMRINQDFEGRVADVGVYGNYAYLAAFDEKDCQKGGVYVFDISNPAAPKQINFIRTGNNSYVGEGIQIIHIENATYKGDVLIHNNEVCGTAKTGAVGGISLVDVTDPKTHKYLARGVGDLEPASVNGYGLAHEAHSAFGWTSVKDGQTYVILVDDEEGKDVDILNISDPRKPVMVAEYDFNVKFSQIVQPDLGTSGSFLHDMIVKRIEGKDILLASYWDGGYVKVDITDPKNLVYLADSDFKNPDPEALKYGFNVKPEGNAHQAEFSKNNDYIVAADEDFSPYSVIARNTTENVEFEATQGGGTPQVTATKPLAGQTVFVGRACPGDPAVPAAAGADKIALVERGECTFTEKVAAVEAAGGYKGVIVFNREGADACSDLLNMDVQGGIPALFVSRPTGYALLNLDPTSYNEAACRAGSKQVSAAIGTLGDAVEVKAVFDGWGYVHLYANNDGKLTELDTYAIPEAFDPTKASGHGDLSVHEVAMSAVRNDLGYLSYYAGGFRVIKIDKDKGELVEVGRFIDQGGNNFWGVQVWQKDGKEYVLASDRDYGLYIFEYTGSK